MGKGKSQKVGDVPSFKRRGGARAGGRGQGWSLAVAAAARTSLTRVQGMKVGQKGKPGFFFKDFI